MLETPKSSILQTHLVHLVKQRQSAGVRLLAAGSGTKRCTKAATALPVSANKLLASLLQLIILRAQKMW